MCTSHRTPRISFLFFFFVFLIFFVITRFISQSFNFPFHLELFPFLKHMDACTQTKQLPTFRHVTQLILPLYIGHRTKIFSSQKRKFLSVRLDTCTNETNKITCTFHLFSFFNCDEQFLPIVVFLTPFHSNTHVNQGV